LDAFSQNRPVVSFLGELGKLLLMFSAGLEIDLGVLRKSRRHSIIFGVLTTTLPLLLGTGGRPPIRFTCCVKVQALYTTCDEWSCAVPVTGRTA
jgi:Kef-type K+ transport system membrane component KefB